MGKALKNIPSTWCLEPLFTASQAMSQQVVDRGYYVACLEGVGTVQVQSTNKAKVVTLSETNPCVLLELEPQGNIACSLFSALGLQTVQVYRRVR